MLAKGLILCASGDRPKSGGESFASVTSKFEKFSFSSLLSSLWEAVVCHRHQLLQTHSKMCSVIRVLLPPHSSLPPFVLLVGFTVQGVSSAKAPPLGC